MAIVSKKILYGFLVVCGLMIFESSYAQTVTLSSDVDSVSVGDIIHLNIKVQLNEIADDIIYPDSSSFPPELTWISVQQFKLTDFSDSLSYKVQYFNNQDVFIPSFPVGLVVGSDTTLLFSNSLTIPFSSILPAQDAELKPIKPILLFDSFPWALLLIILVIIAALIWAYFNFRKTEPIKEVITVVKPVPFSNPLNTLEAELKALKNEYNLSETRDFKYFYSTVSDSIRAYFEELYNIPALESTTRELLRFLDAFGVDHEMIQSTRSVLNKADMVKFAKFEPTLDGAWNCYADAIDFVERAKLIDASRIARKKAEHESQDIAETEEATVEETDLKTEEA